MKEFKMSSIFDFVKTSKIDEHFCVPLFDCTKCAAPQFCIASIYIRSSKSVMKPYRHKKGGKFYNCIQPKAY